MKDYKSRIVNAKKTIKKAEYILIGAGAGLSAAAGLNYAGNSFKENYKEFIEKYNFKDLYSATFYPFKTQEEKWAFWAKLIKLNRYNQPLNLYKELFEMVRDKEYFVFTTNTDGQFEIAGFKKDKIFPIQGDYALLQCENACHKKLYNNKRLVEEWLELTENCEIPEDLVPKCPICGGNMDMNLRKDEKFVQDKNWYKQSEKYNEFLDKSKDNNLLLLEIGVGFNTPGIIRFPFEEMTCYNPNVKLIRINKEYPQTLLKIDSRIISFDENTNKIIEDLKED